MSRLFKHCPGFEARGEDTTTYFYDRCPYCSRFHARCCQSQLPHRICEEHPIVFVDGSCPGNGGLGARAGIGCAIGDDPKDQLCSPVTDTMDPGAPRTSQRAELLAALQGLRFLVCATSTARYHPDCHAPLKCQHPMEYIVVADSEYVVKGMTEWVPQWKVRSSRCRQGKAPKNRDLFQRLEAAVSEYERQGLKIQFFHVPREFNFIADGLAKRATAGPDVTL
ncbi:ribonuclease H-like domain-containing protein [Mycena albidolilacea]|uniref:ribonuclease H n=1 Tax=Mycena albidolilacea TaxID=1033008 RepID=A0AAD7F4S5_9AGAR|nr:ribonuclease H-like domain-containing protein [Mycena albidolilacea]